MQGSRAEISVYLGTVQYLYLRTVGRVLNLFISRFPGEEQGARGTEQRNGGLHALPPCIPPSSTPPRSDEPVLAAIRCLSPTPIPLSGPAGYCCWLLGALSPELLRFLPTPHTLHRATGCHWLPLAAHGCHWTSLPYPFVGLRAVQGAVLGQPQSTKPVAVVSQPPVSTQ